ncbi:hypothetical protein QKT26_gp37 [Carcinus maenas nudivirus]|uniref:Uncharacterized protein n=1 Tax=Carcinus maenas nudivirus TaxID=2880837 RepID=A0AAE9BZV5_9VIRU|nr:hypothetical protein QKT26_gp37 [Carcinus maenas nudivirus]UBZ25627.1 hypothetical protein CmNV_037 [Carcinus maenas nudivirus]
MISFTVISIILIILLLFVLLYLNASYYTNIFILYRPLSGIKTTKGENIDRILTLEESIQMIVDMFNNKF